MNKHEISKKIRLKSRAAILMTATPKGLNTNKKQIDSKIPTPKGLNVKMSTYTQILYQIVFSTKNRERTLTAGKRNDLFKYISGVIKNKNCHLYRINGVEDHIHILTHLHPAVSLSSFVKDIKLASTDHIKKTNLLTNFKGWQEGYGAFTYSYKDKDRLIEYVINQEEHHRNKSFREEYTELLNEHSIELEEKYLL